MESPRHTQGMLKLEMPLNRPETPWFESYCNGFFFTDDIRASLDGTLTIDKRCHLFNQPT